MPGGGDDIGRSLDKAAPSTFRLRAPPGARVEALRQLFEDGRAFRLADLADVCDGRNPNAALRILLAEGYVRRLAHGWYGRDQPIEGSEEGQPDFLDRSPAQARLLEALDEPGSAVDLARRFTVKRETVLDMLSALSRKGLIREISARGPRGRRYYVRAEVPDPVPLPLECRPSASRRISASARRFLSCLAPGEAYFLDDVQQFAGITDAMVPRVLLILKDHGLLRVSGRPALRIVRLAESAANHSTYDGDAPKLRKEAQVPPMPRPMADFVVLLSVLGEVRVADLPALTSPDKRRPGFVTTSPIDNFQIRDLAHRGYLVRLGTEHPGHGAYKLTLDGADLASALRGVVRTPTYRELLQRLVDQALAGSGARSAV